MSIFRDFVQTSFMEASFQFEAHLLLHPSFWARIC